ELDDRCRAVEDLAAAVEDEVVVGGDEGEGDGERRAQLVEGDLMPLPPRAPLLEVGHLREGAPVAECRPATPENAGSRLELLKRPQNADAIREKRFRRGRKIPVADPVTDNERPHQTPT